MVTEREHAAEHAKLKKILKQEWLRRAEMCEMDDEPSFYARELLDAVSFIDYSGVRVRFSFKDGRLVDTPMDSLKTSEIEELLGFLP